MPTIDAKSGHDGESAYLAEILDRLTSKFSGRVRKRRVVEALGRFSYGAALLGRFHLAAAADEARAFVEGSTAAGKGLVSIIGELRKEIRTQPRKGDLTSGRKPQDIRSRVAAAIKAADPKYLRLGPPLFRGLKRQLRRADFHGRADSSELTSLSVKYRGEDPGAAGAFLMSMEREGLVAIGSDPFRKKGAMVVVSGAGALRKLRSSGALSVKRRRHLRRAKRRLSHDEMRSVGLGSGGGVRYSIAARLLFMSLALGAASLLAAAFLSLNFLRVEIRAQAEAEDSRSALTRAVVVADDFRSVIDRARFLISVQDTDEHTDEFFAANPDILFVGVEGKFEFFNVLKIADWGAYREIPARVRSAEAALLEAGKLEPVVGNLTPFVGRPAALIVVPYREGDETHPFTIAVDTSAAIESLGSTEGVYSFIVNAEGRPILHPDRAVLAAGETLSTLPIVNLFLTSGMDSGRTSYFADGKTYLASFIKADFAELGVVSVVPEAVVFAVADRIHRRILNLMAAMFVPLLIFVYLYARSFSGRIGLLMESILRVKGGDFTIDLESQPRDELGALAGSLAEMAGALGERERIAETFGKPVGREIAERAIKNELALGGERRIATLLYTEARGFVDLADDLEPKEAVEYLNEYLTAVVGCVETTGGLVDKLHGDGATALWGIPASSGRDSEAAVDAALLMRAALRSLNQARAAQRKPRIAMGCAVDSGRVLAGRVGSGKRSEYMALGAMVKQVARLEALAKRFEVDILVSESVRVELGSIYRLAMMPRVRVTEKNRPQHVYAVLGRMDDVNAPRSIAELRSRLGGETRGVDVKIPPENAGKK